ncbi:MAG: DUF3343 domain-containing protein [Oscillibacter sp.]|nr:DUF3343 domain-containing protein [Oscillibacter sp.]
MEHDLLLARSVTYAQRMQKALDRAGIASRVYRAPRDLTNLGCAYALRVAPKDLREALLVLRGEKLSPVQIFAYRRGEYREAGYDLS